MGRNRKQRSGGGERGAPAWMVTYGDMMTLLLCFFVLLLSFAEINAKKFEIAKYSLLRALGVHAGMTHPTPGQQPRMNYERIARRLRRRLQVAGKAEEVKVEFDEKGGLRINLPSGLLFDLGSAQLRGEAGEVLESVSDVLTEAPEALIEVVGHTDSLPLSDTSRYQDNYDLSYARAKAVARRIARQDGPALDEMQLVALGPNEPIASNETPEGRQENRRVELYVRGGVTQEEAGEIRRRAREIGQEVAPE